MSSHMTQDLLTQDSDNRRQALDVRQSFIIDAPAGAGKTELLTQRFLALLAHVDEPEQVLALTFTNKAAAEMRHRVLKNLRQAAADNLPTLPHQQQTFKLAKAVLEKDKQCNWGLLSQVTRLQITTLDALCGKLTRQMPLLSRLGSQPQVAVDAELLYWEAAQATLRSLHEDGPNADALDRVLAAMDNNGQQLAKMLAEMLAKRDQWLSHTHQTIDFVALEASFTALVVNDLQTLAKSITANTQRALMPCVNFCASQHLEEGVDDDSARADWLWLESWTQPLTDALTDLAGWRVLAKLLLTTKHELRKTLPKLGVRTNKMLSDQYKFWWASVDHNEVAEALLALAALPDPSCSPDEVSYLQDLREVLQRAHAQLWLVFQQSASVDFIQIALDALFALGEIDEPSELQLMLDYQISHLLVDEFQDTSPIQVELLRRLTAGWQPDDERTVFLVGDPMQSIYKFRKADVGLFLRTRDRGLGDIFLHPLSLYRNNRSCPDVVEWCNKVFPRVFSAADDPMRGAVRFSPAQATRATDPYAGVYWHPVLDSAEVQDELSNAEAEKVIDLIRQAQADRPKGTIAVLVRARTQLTGLLAELRAAEPPLRFQAVEIEGLASRQHVQDLVCLTKAMLHLSDRVSWLAILRAPWCGLLLADLHRLCAEHKYDSVWALLQNDDHLLRLSEDGQLRARHLRDVLVSAFAYQGRQRLRRWVEGVWQALQGPLCLTSEADWLDTQAYFDVLDRIDSADGVDLDRLDGEVEKLFAAPDPEATADLQIMTIHKSKGLEFDTVILPALSRVPKNDDQPMLLCDSVLDDQQGEQLLMAAKPVGVMKQLATPSKYKYLFNVESIRSQHELRRLLYVATTRAKTVLHLVAGMKPTANGELKAPSKSFLGLLWADAEPTFTTALTAQQQRAEQDEQDEQGPKAATVRLAEFRHRLVRLQSVELPPPLRVPLPQHHEADNLGIAATDSGISDESQYSADIGTLVHRYLELFAGRDTVPDDAELVRLRPGMLRWLQSQGHAAVKAAQAADVVLANLRATCASDVGRWVLSTHQDDGKELAFTTIEAGMAHTHIIDRTFVANGCRWIIDYKTTAQPDATKIETYRTQLARYRSLFAPELVVKCAILFTATGELVEVDLDGSE